MSLAVLKRKTKETYKTKKGGFSLNGHRRNISYIGKNYSAIKTTLCDYTNSTNIKPSVLSQREVIRKKKEFKATDVTHKFELIIDEFPNNSETDIDSTSGTAAAKTWLNNRIAYYESKKPVNSELLEDAVQSLVAAIAVGDLERIRSNGAPYEEKSNEGVDSVKENGWLSNEEFVGTITITKSGELKCGEPRPGSIQNICNNWVQRVESDGNKSQSEYIKNKRIEATTRDNSAVENSDNGSECFKRIGGKYYPTIRYVNNNKTMTSGEYNATAIANRGKICDTLGNGFQKPFPYTHESGNNNCRIKNYKQAYDLITENKETPGYYFQVCGDNCK